MKSIFEKISSEKKHKKISIFYILISLLMFALIVSIYINNIIIVNDLTIKNNKIKESIDKEILSNDTKRTEIGKLSSFERIKVIATDKLQLKYLDTAIDERNAIVINESEMK
jgi:cell division protein FtsL